jgi:hypothetical protein
MPFQLGRTRTFRMKIGRQRSSAARVDHRVTLVIGRDRPIPGPLAAALASMQRVLHRTRHWSDIWQFCRAVGSLKHNTTLNRWLLATAFLPGSLAVRAQGACTINIGPDQTICAGQTVQLNGPPGYSNYLWSTGAITPAITVGTSSTTTRH